MPNQNSPALPSKAGQTLGKSGTWITGGIITGEEYNRRLVGKNALLQYDIMRRSDSTIRSTLQLVKLPLLGATWDIQPATINPEEENAEARQKDADFKARFLRRELFKRNVNFDKLLRSLTSGLEFGFDVEEKTLGLTEFEGMTLVGIEKIDKRKQTTIYKWEDGKENPGITQFLLGDTAYMPMDKLIVFTHDKEGDNYEGISLLRYVYKDWDIKDKLTIVNAIAIEKSAVGVPVIEEKEGMTASETDKAKAIESLRNFRANEEGYLLTPSSLGISMLDMKSNSTKEVIPTLQYHDRRISQSILASFMDLGGSSGSGAHSLSKDLTSLFMKSEEAFANMIIACLQEQLIQQLCDLNFTDMSDGYPQLVCTNLADDDIAGLATATSSLVSAGALTPEATLEDHLRDVMKLPALPPEIRDNYEEYKAPTAPAKPEVTNNENDPSLKDQKSKDQAKQAAVSQLKAARRKLIEVEYRD